MLTEYEKVTSLLTYLQAMRGRRLWHYEDVTLTQVAPLPFYEQQERR